MKNFIKKSKIICSKTLKIVKLTSLIAVMITSSTFVYQVNSISADRLGDCVAGDDGDALDGSDCRRGLVCDPFSSVCSYPTEVPCVGGTSICPVGFSCIDDEGSFTSNDTTGTCQPYSGGSAEDNAISEILCNVYKFATGKVGRLGAAMIFLFMGGYFVMGNVKTSTMLVTCAGVGLYFGANTVVSVLVGKGFTC